MEKTIFASKYPCIAPAIAITSLATKDRKIFHFVEPKETIKVIPNDFEVEFEIGFKYFSERNFSIIIKNQITGENGI